MPEALIASITSPEHGHSTNAAGPCLLSRRAKSEDGKIAAIEWVLAHGSSVYFFNTIISAVNRGNRVRVRWTYPAGRQVRNLCRYRLPVLAKVRSPGRNQTAEAPEISSLGVAAESFSTTASAPWILGIVNHAFAHEVPSIVALKSQPSDGVYPAFGGLPMIGMKASGGLGDRPSSCRDVILLGGLHRGTPREKAERNQRESHREPG